jgi:hypothetical protein
MMIATITPVTSPTVPIYSDVSVVGWLVATLEVEFDGGVVVGGSISDGGTGSPRWSLQCACAYVSDSKTEIRKRSSQELHPEHHYPARMRKGLSNRFCPSVCLSTQKSPDLNI